MLVDLDNYFALQKFLVSTVPPEMTAIVQRGGVNDRDLAWLQQEETEDPKDFRFANVLAKADDYLLYPKDAEILRQSLLVLRKAVAIMALFPSGIKVFGYHFGLKFDGFVIHEDDWLEWYKKERENVITPT